MGKSFKDAGTSLMTSGERSLSPRLSVSPCDLSTSVKHAFPGDDETGFGYSYGDNCDGVSQKWISLSLLIGCFFKPLSFQLGLDATLRKTGLEAR